MVTAIVCLTRTAGSEKKSSWHSARLFFLFLVLANGLKLDGGMPLSTVVCIEMEEDEERKTMERWALAIT